MYNDNDCIYSIQNIVSVVKIITAYVGAASSRQCNISEKLETTTINSFLSVWLYTVGNRFLSSWLQQRKL